jgi:hypothetical protein
LIELDVSSTENKERSSDARDLVEAEWIVDLRLHLRARLFEPRDERKHHATVAIHDMAADEARTGRFDDRRCDDGLQRGTSAGRGVEVESGYRHLLAGWTVDAARSIRST